MVPRGIGVQIVAHGVLPVEGLRPIEEALARILAIRTLARPAAMDVGGEARAVSLEALGGAAAAPVQRGKQHGPHGKAFEEFRVEGGDVPVKK